MTNRKKLRGRKGLRSRPRTRRAARLPRSYTKDVIPSVIKGREVNQVNGALATCGFATIGTSIVSFDITKYVPAGTDFGTRTGRAIQLERVLLRGSLIGGQVNGAADESRNTIRLAMVVCSPFMPSIPGAAFNLNYPIDKRTWPTLKRVLWDKTLLLRSPDRDSVGYLPAGLQVDVEIPVREIVNYYGATTGYVSDNSVFLVAVSDSALAPNPGFTTGSITIEYIDV